MRNLSNLLLPVFLLFALMAKGQSTFLLPYNGATQTYTASVIDTELNNSVRWYVATDMMGATKAVHGVDYEFVSAGYDSGVDALVGTAVYTVDITWGNNITIGTNLFVFLEVDDDVTGCTNRMALRVEVAGKFNALVYDVTGSDHPESVRPEDVNEDITEETCPGDIENPLWNGTGHTDIGYSELVYRVEREYSVLAWQFEFEISEDANVPFIIENITMVDESGTQLYNSTTSTGLISIDFDQDYVLVYVQLTNQQDQTLNIDFDLITNNNNTKDIGDNLDSDPLDNNDEHTILPMPAITGFGGN